jgi:hypothetical protein
MLRSAFKMRAASSKTHEPRLKKKRPTPRALENTKRRHMPHPRLTSVRRAPEPSTRERSIRVEGFSWIGFAERLSSDRSSSLSAGCGENEGHIGARPGRIGHSKSSLFHRHRSFHTSSRSATTAACSTSSLPMLSTLPCSRSVNPTTTSKFRTREPRRIGAETTVTPRM